MLQNIRANMKGTFAKIVLVIITIPFVLFGAESLFTGGSGEPKVLEVNGEEITERQFQQELYLLRNQMASQMGENIDYDKLSDENLTPAVIDRLTQRELITQISKELNLEIPEVLVLKTISQTPAFQVDGQFSEERFNRVLTDFGYTPTNIKLRVEDDLRVSYLQNGISGSVFTTLAEGMLISSMINEKRVVNWAQLNLSDFTKDISITEEDIKNYYEENKESYVTPLLVDADYIVLDSENLKEEITEQAIKEEYQSRKTKFIGEEVRNIAHIVREINKDQTEQEARAVLAEVQERFLAGEPFADLAKTYSQEVASAAMGGELGEIEQDGTFPKVIEDAAFALAPNKLSEILTTEQGLHLLIVTDLEKEEILPYEMLRDEIEEQLSKLTTDKNYAIASEKLADIAFNAENLAEPANELDLTIQTEKQLSRDSIKGESVFSDKRVRDALFSEDVLEEGMNSELIELGSGKSIIVRVNNKTEPRQKSLDEVKSVIVEIVKNDLANEKLQAKAEEIKNLVNSGQSFADVSKKYDLALNTDITLTRQSVDVEPALNRAVFFTKRSESKGNILSAESTTGDKLFLYEITEIDTGESSDVQAKILSRQVQMANAQQTMLAFLSSLEKNAEIQEY